MLRAEGAEKEPTLGPLNEPLPPTLGPLNEPLFGVKLGFSGLWSYGRDGLSSLWRLPRLGLLKLKEF